MIQAIIFDCFGVLATEAWSPFKERYFGHDKTLFEDATDLSHQANAGLLTYAEFVEAVAEMAAVDAIKVQDALKQNVPNEPLFAYIEQLKAHYKIGFLSNSASDRAKDIFTTEHIALFDSIVMSYEVGLIKPDTRIYILAAERLGVDPADCVFVDDQPSYVQAAVEVGMHGICYESFAQTKLELEQILAK